jgi:G3E family GTPase
LSIRVERPATLEGFKRWFDTLLWQKADVLDIFRIKGVLNVADSDRKLIVQVCRGCGHDRHSQAVPAAN